MEFIPVIDMEKMKKLYYLLFYKIYNFFNSLSEDGWEKWKALVVIGVAEMLLFVELIVWWTVTTKVGVNISKFWIIGLGLVIAGFNYYFFLHHNQWEEYESEFKQLPKNKNRLAGWLTFLALLFVLGSIIFAFYQMSLIDWSKYR